MSQRKFNFGKHRPQGSRVAAKIAGYDAEQLRAARVIVANPTKYGPLLVDLAKKKIEQLEPKAGDRDAHR